jgi:dsRNA-specific ribonuclease
MFPKFHFYKNYNKYSLKNYKNRFSLRNDTDQRLKRKHSTDDQESLKKVKIEQDLLKNQFNTNTSKNSIQQLYEIKQIQPIEFEMLSSEGPQHKPIFKFSLKFKFNDFEQLFNGEGLNKKAAKTVAAIKALLFLIENCKNFDKEYLKALISFDMKLHNIKDFEISNVKPMHESLNEKDNESLLLKNEKTNIENIEKPIIENNEKTNIQNYHSESKILRTAYDLKTREIIATKIPMTIFSHMLASTQNYSFNCLSETGMSHSKLFKMELRIEKNCFDSPSIVTTVDLKTLNANESLLFTEFQNEYSFIGFGPSLKLAKSRAAQLALEFLFDIKITSPGF